MSGGEEGPIISMSSPMESEILKRIHLPREEKNTCPLKRKINYLRLKKN